MTEPMTEHRREASPRRKARMAGAFYLLTFLTGTPALFGCADGGCRVGLADLLAAAARKPPVTLHFLPQAFSGKERSRCGSSVMGVNSERWQEPASAAGFGRVRGSRTDESFTRFVFSYLRGDFGTVLWRRRFVFP